MFPLLKMTRITVVTSIGLLAACSNDYQPSENTTEQEMYEAACASCHTGSAEAPNKYWAMDSKNANKTYISYKVKAGGLRMPKFPNMSTNDLEKLSVFVLEHSTIK